MKAGIDQVANLVKVTMGVRGKNIILDTNPYQRPLITNDGATIARGLIIKDPIENIGAGLIREIAEKTNDNAGDGTTTTMLLMQAIVENGMKALSNGADGIQLRKGITKAVEGIIKHLQSEKVPANDLVSLTNVATISCRNAEIGALIAEVVLRSGVDGMITVEDRFQSDTVFERQEGLKLTGGWLSELYINLQERKQTTFSDVPVLVTDRTITLGEEMARIMETVSSMGKKEAVIIAGGIEGDALTTSMVNWQKQAIYILPIRVLTYGDAGQGALKDVASITGATYLDEYEKTLLDITKDDFGRAHKIVADKRETTVISNNTELINERVYELNNAIKTSNEFETDNLKQRIARLKSAIFTVKVGGKTETERNELKTRIDDSIKASQSALESGVVAGGGSALYRAVQAQEKADVTNDIGIGKSIVYNACIAPIEQMAINSGIRLDRSDLKAIKSKKKAIDFSTGEVVDAFKTGVIDPLKVVTECIENASSQAGLFLTLDGAVIHIEDDK